MKLRTTMTAVLAAVALILAACGGSESAEPPEAGGADSGVAEGDTDGATAAAPPASDSPCSVVREQGETVDDYVARLYEAAQEEGTIVYYTPASDREVELFDKFWQENFSEVELEMVSAGTDTILQRALTEGRAGNVKADAMQTSTSEAVVLEDAGLLATYRAANEEFVDPELIFEDRPFIPVFYLSFHAAYNTDNVDPGELPTEWSGFTEPEWRGRTAIDQNAVEWVAGLIEGMGEEDAIALLEGLVANDVRLVEGTTLRTELLGAGEFDVMLDGYGHSLKKFIDEGSPIAVVDPHPEPLTQELGFAVLMQDAPHPCAARLAGEFLLSPAGQQIYAERNKAGARSADESIPHPYEDLFGGAVPTPLGPGTDYDRARQVLEEVVVRGTGGTAGG